MALAYGYQLWRAEPVTRPVPFIDGIPMPAIAPLGAWGGLHTKTFLNGDAEATWSITNPDHRRLSRHPALVYGAPVEIKLGPCIISAGTLTEPNWDDGTLTMMGAAHEGDSALCLNGSGQTTSKPNTAIDHAIATGLVSWTRRDNFGNTAIGNADDASSGLTHINELLDAWAEENDSGWAVTPRRELIITGSPTAGEPRWYITPGTAELGQADDDRVDQLVVRYEVSGGGGALANVVWPATVPVGGRQRGVLITGRGPITTTRATTIAKGIYNKLGGHSGWTNGITVNTAQISTPGGQAANLGFIRAGDTTRMLDVLDPRGTDHHLDVVLDQTDCDWDAGTIQLDPVGKAKRSLEDVLTQDYAKYGYTAL